MNFSTFWTSCFYSLEWRFFVLEYSKRHFPGLYCLKKIGKMAIFGPKPWVKPFWKNVNFSTFWTSCFYSLERRFYFPEYRKRHFPGLYYIKKKKKMEKWPFLGPKPWVNPLEKSQFLDFLNVFFYSLEMRFFILKYFKTHFSCLYCLKKGGKIAIFGP